MLGREAGASLGLTRIFPHARVKRERLPGARPEKALSAYCLLQIRQTCNQV